MRTIAELETLESKDIYFRITSRDDNLDGFSVETPDVTPAKAAELFGVDEVDLDDELESRELQYRDGGIYWNGICCTESVEELINYFGIADGNLTGLDDLVLVVFRGEWVESCGDGEVVRKRDIIEKINLTDIRW